MANLFDCLIIGGGPAGLSTALTIARQAQSAVVFDSKEYRDEGSTAMHIVLTWDHEDPVQFRATAKKNLTERYPAIEIQDVKVKGVESLENGHFKAISEGDEEWYGKKVVLATGVEDVFPDIQGYSESWIKGIYNCCVCSGYEDRTVPSCGVLAVEALSHPMRALYAARHVSQFAKVVRLYTHGSEDLAKDIFAGLGTATNFEIESRHIRCLEKSPKHAEVTIHFADGTSRVEGFIGHAPQTRIRGPFAKQLGLELDPQGDIVAKPPFNETNVAGVFVAGDNCSPSKIVSNALYGGNLAGTGVSGQILAEEMGQV